MKPTRYTRSLTGQIRKQQAHDRAKRAPIAAVLPSSPHHKRHDHKGAHVAHNRKKKGE